MKSVAKTHLHRPTGQSMIITPPWSLQETCVSQLFSKCFLEVDGSRLSELVYRNRYTVGLGRRRDVIDYVDT